MEPQALTLLQLQQRIKGLLAVPQLRDVWITAELSDVRTSGGHCYMEMLQKDDQGRVVAKCRGAMWANVYGPLSRNFMRVTGHEFATGLKVMLRVTVGYHEVYGMSMVVNDVNPEFTMGDLLRRRRENILRLQREGILNANRELPIATPPLRIAVVSAAGAAGYGDFVNQIVNNPSRLAFKLKLFPAKLQGEGTPQSIINELSAIVAEEANWDCVVIIRGGGASSDLLAFEDYELAAAVAQFPLPVIIGIGHERDITLLDYVAYMRVKTPTAAAEWLIGEGERALDRLRRAAMELQRLSAALTQGAAKRLSSLASQLTLLPGHQIQRADERLSRWAMSVKNISSGCLAPMGMKLDVMADAVKRSSLELLRRRLERLDALGQLIDAYSPQATLKRGFTMSVSAGTIIRSVAELREGMTVTTLFADGRAESKVEKIENIK